ncbi:DUF937 domain-containing protein [Pseudoxanthomonas dokdonensis]|uniref:Calcium-binding protein n=1 Tax=Pseudoxanthomonas dokdonensis TaxID=344882 RepID=A0A0R0CH53_9GAMM|nr:DUF937 domain-containing protein [Pseudoxanthomonas dokdonensis]KRG69212.1 calcium-binding protein [Pseudoxanthomonas dokdonensis]
MNNNASMVDDLMQQLQGAPLQQLSRQLGIDPAQASQAVGAALPMMMGALGRNAAQPQGADSLFAALQNNHSGLDIGSVLGAVMGTGTSPQTDGAGILGHIFGGAQPRAEAGLGQATGIGNQTASQLMKMLAPIVMAYLAKRMFSGGQADPAQLGQALGQEQQQITQQAGIGGNLLGAVFDQDGDGQLGMSDLMSLGSKFLGGGR